MASGTPFGHTGQPALPRISYFKGVITLEKKQTQRLDEPGKQLQQIPDQRGAHARRAARELAADQ